jgi:hypothetical protein
MVKKLNFHHGLFIGGVAGVLIFGVMMFFAIEGPLIQRLEIYQAYPDTAHYWVYDRLRRAYVADCKPGRDTLRNGQPCQMQILHLPLEPYEAVTRDSAERLLNKYKKDLDY